MKLSIITLICTLLICSMPILAKTKTSAEVNNSKKSKKLSCSKRKRVGSHFRVKSACRSSKQKAKDRDDARTIVDKQSSFRARAITPVGN